MYEQKQTQAGFTLTEVMIAIVLMSILLAFGVPAFTTVQKDQIISSAASTLLSALAQARSEAVKRNARVTICNRNVEATTPTCSTGSDDPDGYGYRRLLKWQYGWLVFVDDNRNGSYDPTEQLILHQQELQGQLRLHRANFDDLYYNGTGAVSNTWSFFLCDDRSEVPVPRDPARYGREIALGLSGRATIYTFAERGVGPQPPDPKCEGI